ncbi:MAG: hypothetical protein MJ246_08710 [Clostridia bacterium]|nr:hypothetical protein [Clostridia bacterium]
MDLKKMSSEELEYELVDVNQKLSEIAALKRRGIYVPQKKLNSYLKYKREIQREMRSRNK